MTLTEQTIVKLLLCLCKKICTLCNVCDKYTLAKCTFMYCWYTQENATFCHLVASDFGILSTSVADPDKDLATKIRPEPDPQQRSQLWRNISFHILIFDFGSGVFLRLHCTSFCDIVHYIPLLCINITLFILYDKENLPLFNLRTFCVMSWSNNILRIAALDVSR